MTNLDYLREKATNTELFFYTHLDSAISCETFEDLIDSAMIERVIDRNKIFNGTKEDIARRFVFAVISNDCPNVNTYITLLFNHEVISDTYYDYKNYDNPADSLVAKIVEYFNEEKVLQHDDFEEVNL